MFPALGQQLWSQASSQCLQPIQLSIEQFCSPAHTRVPDLVQPFLAKAPRIHLRAVARNGPSAIECLKHVHADSLPMNVQHMPVEDLFAMMKREAATRQNKKADN